MSDLAPAAPPLADPPSGARTTLLRRLWAGEVPLGRVFWSYAIGLGSLLSVLATLAAMAALTVDGAELIGLGLYALPIPYNVLMVVAVWRSADAYAGPRLWADLARTVVLIWAVLASIA